MSIILFTNKGVYCQFQMKLIWKGQTGSDIYIKTYLQVQTFILKLICITDVNALSNHVFFLLLLVADATYTETAVGNSGYGGAQWDRGANLNDYYSRKEEQEVQAVRFFFSKTY